MSIKTKIINQFLVKSESGKTYQIIVLQNFIVGYDPRHPNAEYPGTTEYRTDDDLQVEPINYYRFKILESGEIVKRIENN